MIFLKKFKEQKDILHAILERKDGSVNPFLHSKAQKNILKAVKKVKQRNIKVDDLIFSEQVHGSNVYFYSDKVGDYIKLKTDGLVTEIKEKALIIKTADCLPLLLYSPKQKRIGAVHIGRKGLVKEIVEKALKFFNSELSCLIVGIGPHIRKCCYFLRERSKSYAHHAQWRKYVEKRDNKLYFDLTKGVIDILLKSGVKKENIEDCNICTFCQGERFFSSRKNEQTPGFYKKDEINGKLPCFATFIMLKR